MAYLTDADLESETLDLTGISLADLRDLTTSELATALTRTYLAAEFNTGNELQEQQG